MKKVIEFIKELKKKPYGKGVLFFGFYLIFFIIVFIIIGIGGSNKTKKYENTSNFNTKYLENYNYSFEYKVVLDNNTYSYIGNKNNDIFNYTYDGKNYYNSKDKSYIKEEEKEVDNPIKFYSLFDKSIMDKIINSSYIESKTTYDNGTIVYNLLISSNTLNKLLNDKDTDVEEIPNKIKVSISNGFINEINYDLNSYCKINDSCSSLNITITYKEFSKIS